MPESLRKMFQLGTKVVVSARGGWQRDAVGVIVAGPEPVQTLNGEDFYWWVEFSEPERDAGNDGPYSKAQILSHYIVSATPTQCPAELGGAVVAKAARIEPGSRTESTLRAIGGKPAPVASQLAIAEYPGQAGFHLFRCDQDWNVMLDTWHSTIADAEAQAEFEYVGITAAWRPVR